MTIDNPDETAAAPPAAEAPPAVADVISEESLIVSEDGADAPVLVPLVAVPGSDSMPPTSRKLAPPPKPRRESGPAPARTSSQPAADGGASADSLVASALKAPTAPTISYRPEARAAAGVPPVVTEGNEPERSQPPPIPRRRSSPSIPGDTPAPDVLPLTEPMLPTAPSRPASNPALASARTVSSPALAASRPLSSPAFTSSRPVSSPALTSSRPVSSPALTPSRPVSSPSLVSPLFPPRSASLPAHEPATARSPVPPSPIPVIPSDEVPRGTSSRPPSASKSIQAMRIIAIGESQRPPPVSVDVAVDSEARAAPPSELPAPLEIPISVSTHPPPPPPPLTPSGSPPPVPVRARVEEVAEVLHDDDVAPASSERTPAQLEELGRDDAISVPPDEPAAVAPSRRAELKSEGKPPPPPKRLPRPPEATPVEAEAPPPVPAAAATAEAPSIKGAPKSKARHPWWEDLFNEDFMRANKRLSDQQIRREVSFIEESLGVAAGGVVLDLGCGDGHHAVELASRGYGVVGYDLSLYQLALAADVAQERGQKINFLQGDMREMAFEEMFDGVFCWNTTFGYFEEEKNLAVAQRVFKALRPGGMFLVDVVNRDYAAAQAPQQLWYEGDSCVCMDDMSIDYIASRLRVKRSIILDDGRTKESTYSLRLYTMNELGKLLHEVGFRVTEASGHPSTPGVFFGPNSPRVIMLAQRP